MTDINHLGPRYPPNRLSRVKDKSMSAFWPVDPPRYQVLIISDLRDKEVLHRNALLWFAPRSSEKVENVQGAQNEHAGSGAASVTGKYRAHVPVFAWKVIAPCDLKELFHTAVFFAEDSAQERRQIGIEATLTLGQFLSGIESNNL